jgi:hypothetical protein
MIKKHSTWKQAKPVDQLVAIRAAIEGNLSNFRDGIIDQEKMLKRVNGFLHQIALLEPFLTNPNLWDR